MTTRFLSFVAAGLVFGAAPAWSQSAPSATLTVTEVHELAVRGQPSDHARLAQYFTALADAYAAESKRHEAMGRSGLAQTGRLGREQVDIHCKRLVVLNAHLELTSRALSAYHHRSVLGRALPLPSAPADFDVHTPTAEELANFRVPIDQGDDHRATAAHFTALAKRYEAQVAAHAAMAAAYRGNSRLAGAATHCDRLVTLARDAAREARAAAQMHARLGAGTN